MTDRAAWPAKAFVVSHTHWDREWYLPFHRFRVRLVEVVRRVLDALENDPDFEHFLLDGQSVLLEDYLAVHPEDADRLNGHVGRGALAIGPWYVLPDEFLVSGEATVRNLLEGHRVAHRVGPPQRVGYLPDSFGHIAQMPQILRRAGIGTFVFSRGGGDETDQLGWEFLWQAPDGSRVTAVQQCRGYCAAGGLGFEPMSQALTERTTSPDLAVGRIRELLDDMRALARTDVVLISNGCDHHPPQRDLGDVLVALRAAFPHTTFTHTSLAAYLEAVQARMADAPTYQGELLGGKRQFILPGVWSSRMYLKQANDEAQELLAGCTEPLLTYLHARGVARYPGALLGEAWRLLLRNHPHDSICGCSVDEVHRAMVPRFQGVIDTSDELIRSGLERLVVNDGRHPSGAPVTLVAFNPHPVRRRAIIERTVAVPSGQADDWELLDGAGRPVPFQVVASAEANGVWSVDYRGEWDGRRQVPRAHVYMESEAGRVVRPDDAPVHRPPVRMVTFHAALPDLPAVGLAEFTLRPGSGARQSGLVRIAGDTIDNGLVRVRVAPDGTLDLTHLPSGASHPGLHRLIDEADVGDEYDFAQAPNPGVRSTLGLAGRVSPLASTSLIGRLEWRSCWPLPRAIATDRSGRSAEQVDCDLRLVVTIRDGSPVVELELEVDNLARDHRLRAAFATGIASDTVISDGHFFHNRRPAVRAPKPDWHQPPAGTWPQQEFTLVHEGSRGLALLNRGLPEIQAVPGDDGVTLLLTLLRSVGWLSRDDFAERRFANAGPTVPTPDAQCLGPQRFRYALVPGEADPVQVARFSRAYRTPVMIVEGDEPGIAAMDHGLLEVADARLVVSAIKKHDTRETVVVRLTHMNDRPAQGAIRFGWPVGAAWRTDLLEERLEPVPLDSGDDRLVILSLGAWEIATIEVALEIPPAT
jgi:alpha-mannosidase